MNDGIMRRSECDIGNGDVEHHDWMWIPDCRLAYDASPNGYWDFLGSLRAIAKKLCIDLSAAVVAKFDEVSRQRGCHIFLGPTVGASD